MLRKDERKRSKITCPVSQTVVTLEGICPAVYRDSLRVHLPKWAFTLLSGEGAKQHGGRFNRPGIDALYISLDPATAWMEAQQGFPFKPQPMTLVAYQVDFTDIIDLDNSNMQKTLGYSLNDFACAWEDLVAQKQEPLTCLLADELEKRGIAGILIRSFTPDCTEQNRNLILWKWSEDPPHAIQIIDGFKRLPKSQDSWGSEHLKK